MLITQDELTTIAYQLLKSYVPPSKAFDVLEKAACQSKMASTGEVFISPETHIDAVRAAASALYEAEKRVSKESKVFYQSPENSGETQFFLAPIDFDEVAGVQD